MVSSYLYHHRLRFMVGTKFIGPVNVLKACSMSGDAENLETNSVNIQTCDRTVCLHRSSPSIGSPDDFVWCLNPNPRQAKLYQLISCFYTFCWINCLKHYRVICMWKQSTWVPVCHDPNKNGAHGMVDAPCFPNSYNTYEAMWEHVCSGLFQPEHFVCLSCWLILGHVYMTG